MPSLIDIRRRIRSTKSTQQITKAMKMVSSSKLRRAQERIVHSRPYAQEMLRVFNNLATRVDPSAHPLLNADPWGGVVNYDWYVNPQTPNERFKATVFILDQRLRADALNVSITKQVKNAEGEWTAAPVAAQTETDLENAILTKARQLNLANGG